MSNYLLKLSTLSPSICPDRWLKLLLLYLLNLFFLLMVQLVNLFLTIVNHVSSPECGKIVKCGCRSEICKKRITRDEYDPTFLSFIILI